MLNDKQIRFCEEYLKDYNGTRAAIDAGYSKKTANRIASENLSKPDIQDYLNKKKEKIAKKLEITQERTMLEIARIAYQDVRQFYDEEGGLIPIHELSDDAAAALAGFDVEELFAMGEKIGIIKKIKRYDKTKALEMLAKHFNIFDDGPKINNNINLGGLSAEDLKALLLLKQKASK